MNSLTELFCLIEDFCQTFEPAWEQRLLANGQKKRRRAASLSTSELITLAVLFHQLRYRQFKRFYLPMRYGFCALSCLDRQVTTAAWRLCRVVRYL